MYVVLACTAPLASHVADTYQEPGAVASTQPPAGSGHMVSTGAEMGVQPPPGTLSAWLNTLRKGTVCARAANSSAGSSSAERDSAGPRRRKEACRGGWVGGGGGREREGAPPSRRPTL